MRSTETTWPSGDRKSSSAPFPADRCRISASDRSGLLYAVARVLAQYRINLQLAKVSTLGERVEDTFLVDGAALQNNRLQIQVETELLDAISAT